MSKNQKAEKTKCQRCDSTEIAVAVDHSNKHYCQKCQHVWVPGLEGMKREDVLITHLKTENMGIKLEIDKLRKENLGLVSQVKKLEKEVATLKGEEIKDDAAAELEMFT